MDNITLPIPKLNLFKNIDIIKKIKILKQKKEKNKKKYLDQILK